MVNKNSSSQFAVVTGASSGIGLELAKQFAQHGFDLLITAESDGIFQAAQELAQFGTKVETVRADLSTYDGVDTLYDAIQQRERPVDAIAINAGVGVGGEFTQTDLKAELKLIDLNIKSVVHLTKHILKDMVARGSGRILYTASIASVMPGPYEAVYAASKAFVYSFSEAIRNEVKDKGVTVTALLPGPTDTNFFHRAGMDDTVAGAIEKEKTKPDEVARKGFEALMNGDDHVIASTTKIKLQTLASKLMPETAKAEHHSKMTEPVSAKKAG